MTSQGDSPWIEAPPVFVTALPDVVEARLLARQQVKELDKEVNRLVLEELRMGTNQSDIAQVLGVSRSRINQIKNLYNL